MTGPVVIVTGSRLWAEEEPIHAALAAANPSLVVHGGARGADAIAHDWATLHGVPSRMFAANWLKYGRGAGPARNALMLKAYPGALVLAFPLDGPGTRDCIRQARERRMDVRVWEE